MKLNYELPKIMTECISLYQQRSQLLLNKTSNILNESDDDIIISLIHFLVNIPSTDFHLFRRRNLIKTWQFVSLLRLYLNEKDIQGIHMSTKMVRIPNINAPLDDFSFSLNRASQYKYTAGNIDKQNMILVAGII